MSELTRAEEYLIEQIRQGSEDGWSQLVQRYQGRLVAFARSKLPQSADAEDLVQDTFVGFLKGLPQFREQASLETYLFTILRRKIVNWFRGKRTSICLLEDVLHAGRDDESGGAAEQFAAPDPTASWYARRDEENERQYAALSTALRQLINGYKESGNFRDLQIVEMLFYCHLRNRDAARHANLNEKHVALIKHRCLKQIREHVVERLGASVGAATLLAGATGDSPHPADLMLSQVWQDQRLSCLKRSTIGAYLLGTLDAAWHEYVAFHLERLGCQFCRANLEDLRQKSADDVPHALRERILESTVGFFKK